MGVAVGGHDHRLTGTGVYDDGAFFCGAAASGERQGYSKGRESEKGKAHDCGLLKRFDRH
jgi:hypothetical protein